MATRRSAAATARNRSGPSTEPLRRSIAVLGDPPRRDDAVGGSAVLHEVDCGTAVARPTPTTARERWAEVAGISHEGVALLDESERFVFLSEGTACVLGVGATTLVGSPLAEAIPELTPDDLTAIADATHTGLPTMVMCTRRGADGWIRALRLTFVPRRGDDGGQRGLLVLSHDITLLRVAQDQRRRAQHRLTAVEDDEQRRIRREMHDGPIQILAALSLRAGMAAGRGIDVSDLRALEHAVDHAAQELRRILSGAIASGQAVTPRDLLCQWAAPLLEESDLHLDVVDRSGRTMNRATTEALFAFVHEAIKRAATSAGLRQLTALITDDGPGHRLVLTLPAGSEASAARQLDERAARRYAALLGGWYDEVAGTDTTTMIAFLPPLDEQGWRTTEAPGGLAPLAPAGGRHGDAFGCTAELTDDDFEAMAGASFQGIMELDRRLRVTSVNEAYSQAARLPVREIVGRQFETLFHRDEYARLRPMVRRVQRVEPVRFEWRRRNAVGETRWTQVAVSPRTDADGRFDGALVVTLDTTDLHLAEDLRDAVLVDVGRARRAARRRTARRLAAGPIQTLERVDERLSVLVARNQADDVIGLIQDELRRSIAALRSSVTQIDELDPCAAPWHEVLRESLAIQLRAHEFVLGIDDQTVRPPRAHQAAALVGIAREAVINAIRHGRASRVAVLLDDTEGHYRMRVTDDGIGVGREALHPNPGHLGTRSMRERAAEQNGTFRIGRRRSGGTIVTVTIPHADITIVPI